MTATERQPSGLALALRDPWPWLDLVGLVRLGESLGYRALFLPEVGSRDTLAALTGLAGETARLRLGTGIVPMPSRSPALLGMAAATVQERSGGRLILGLGTGPSGPGALARLRELVVAMKRLLRDGTAELEGRTLSLSLVPDVPPPVWIAALGSRAVRAAGEVADGVLLNWCTPERVARAVDEVGEGARAAGRDPAAVTVAVYVRAGLGDDPAEQRSALRTAAGEYASYPAYARQFAAMGLAEGAEGAAAAHRGGRPDGVPDGLVDAVCLWGDPAAARERLAAYRAAGAELAVVYPVVGTTDPVGDARRTLERLAP
jgi:alkanesulfonate monooxygenase SsuD/methylene tetrahydromethanopterin reductase-like flavin-dependent oxidoreductase (luciferase family)